MGSVYLTNAFSLNMLEPKTAAATFKPISVEEAKKLLTEEGFVSFVSHGSTAQVLRKLLGLEVEVNRSNLVLKDGVLLVVFQLSVRPREGQVFTEKELEEIAARGLYRFWLVRVCYAAP
ncbi:MAG: DUF1874 domain-containing protein [Aquificae bacterium]|nr:DUF1874 domain-containing protein [Aquificota bacterium]